MMASTDRRCRHCGCMDHRACLTPDGPCAWIDQDVCSHPDCVRAANATLWPHRGWLAGLADRLVNGPGPHLDDRRPGRPGLRPRRR